MSTVIDTGTYSSHPVNCYIETATQLKHLGKIIDQPSGNKVPDKVVLSTGGKKQLSKTPPSFTTRTKKGVLFD